MAGAELTPQHEDDALTCPDALASARSSSCARVASGPQQAAFSPVLEVALVISGLAPQQLLGADAVRASKPKLDPR